MCDSTVVKELPETSIWHGAISEEDVALVRRRHAEKVEEWLDFADFATELFALHEKYGIEKGEEGYAAYRKHLRTGYYEKLYTYGPTPDPLDEGCDCIFCRMHADEPEACRVRCADQPGEMLHREAGPHSGPYESVINSTASGECELSEAMLNQPRTDVPRSPIGNHDLHECRLGQVPAEPRGDLDPSTKPPVARSASNAMIEPGSKKLGPVPAYEKIDDEIEAPPYDEEYERVAGDTSRYDSVGGVEPDWEYSEKIKPGPIVPIYPLNPSPPPSPYSKKSRLGQVPAEPRGDLDPSAKPPVARSASNAMIAPGSKKLGPVPAYEKIDDEIEAPPYDEEYERVAGDTSRYDSVGGVEPDWEYSEKIKPGPIVPIYPLNPSPPPSPYSKKSRLGQVPAESPIGPASTRDQTPLPKSATIPLTEPGLKKLRPVPAHKKNRRRKRGAAG